MGILSILNGSSWFIYLNICRLDMIGWLYFKDMISYGCKQFIRYRDMVLWFI